MSTILEEAEALVNGPRADAYGDPAANLARIGNMWSELLGVRVSPEQVCLCMAALKIARLAGPKPSRDSYVDAAGYLRLAEMIGAAE